MLKNILTLTTLSGLLILSACGGDKDGGDSGTDTAGGTGTGTGDDDDDDDDDTGPVELLIMDVAAGCADGSWVYSSNTQGWTSDAVVNAWEVLAGGAGWDEEHTVPSVMPAADGSADYLERVLDDATAVGSFTPDVNTVFSCGVHDTSAAMTYALRVYDIDGVYADCAIWGGEVDAVLDGSGDVTDYNTISNPSEISRDNCVVF